MTVALCIPIPAQESFRTQWDHVRAHFMVDEFYVIGDGHLRSAAELPEYPLVVLQPITGRHVRGVTSLRDFSHPEDVIYLFGPDETQMSLDLLGGRVPDHIVYVPTDTRRDMFSFVVFSVVMWDRGMKSL